MTADEEKEKEGDPTTAFVLQALSAPDQAFRTGVTPYRQVPGGTAASVHDSPLMVPLHAERIVAGMPVPAAYRATR